MLEEFQVAISPQPVVRPTSCFVLWWGFRGRRIEWRYFRCEQIQEGSRRHLRKVSNGHISGTRRISPQRLTIYLYSAHRAVIFAIAELFCSISCRTLNTYLLLLAAGDGSRETAMETRTNGVIPTQADGIQTSKSFLSSSAENRSLESLSDEISDQGLLLMHRYNLVVYRSM